ncbi:DDE superfamily endonuclease [Popillia japonica]|uniref:DDE superfamily endonuclease n=1 Tax=Popillia japonica TaxID=7064 RepID=A0AAW1MZT7_POPJA
MARLMWRLQKALVYHIPLYLIWKNLPKFKDSFKITCQANKKLRCSQYDDIDKTLLRWFKEKRSQGNPITGPILKPQIDFGKLLGLENYECSESLIKDNIVGGTVSEIRKNYPLDPITDPTDVCERCPKYSRFLRDWNKELCAAKKKILLVDNCSAHLNVQNLKAINLCFLPPNTTSVLQPFDQGIIKNHTVHFRKALVMMISTEDHFEDEHNIPLAQLIRETYIVDTDPNLNDEDLVMNSKGLQTEDEAYEIDEDQGEPGMEFEPPSTLEAIKALKIARNHISINDKWD